MSDLQPPAGFVAFVDLVEEGLTGQALLDATIERIWKPANTGVAVEEALFHAASVLSWQQSSREMRDDTELWAKALEIRRSILGC